MTGAPSLAQLKVKIFADGADLDAIREMSADPLIKGFTTNPTLMRRAEVNDYKDFALEVLQVVADRPVSFEVFADEFEEMARQALEIASWGGNVYVKIPVTNTNGQSSARLVEGLSTDGVQLNITAIFTLDQVREITAALAPDTPAILSIFAGRIADSGRDPVPLMRAAPEIMASKPKAELLWASPRELLNVVQSAEIGWHIITETNDIRKKLPLLGKDLTQFSRETVELFYRDAAAAGYTIKTDRQAAE